MGRSLRRLREQAGFTQEEAGAPIRVSKSKLSRIEQGHLPGYNDFAALLDRYGVLSSDFGEYVRMYDAAKEPGWWPRNVPRNFGYVEVEASACAIRQYEIGLMPGLLQTASYTRRLFEHSHVPWSDEDVGRNVAVRLRRQRRLTEDPDFKIHLIIDESAFYRPWCDREQVEAVIEGAALPSVTVQVLALSALPHGGLHGGFAILDFPDSEEPGMVYLEGAFGSLHLESPKEIGEARAQFKHLRKLALDEPASVELLKHLAVVK
ncbi:MAG TPA: helix-turn-helix transcriptional regulator [Amycolatopsis sp.]|nr:helix-turn-helix transcriptional regulator [Amycolatopsis sp.]